MTRMWHTACCTTSPGEVLIFGGCATSVLILEQVNRQQFQIHASVCIIYCTVSIYATVYLMLLINDMDRSNTYMFVISQVLE